MFLTQENWKKSKSVGAGLDLPPNQPTQSCLPLYICARLAVKSKMARIDLIWFFQFPRLKPFILDENYWNLGPCIFVTYFETYRWRDYLFDRLEIAEVNRRIC